MPNLTRKICTQISLAVRRYASTIINSSVGPHLGSPAHGFYIDFEGLAGAWKGLAISGLSVGAAPNLTAAPAASAPAPASASAFVFASGASAFPSALALPIKAGAGAAFP